MVTIYIAVDIVAEHLKKVEEQSGKTIMPETVVPNKITFGFIVDPEGNIIGLVKNERPKRK